MARRDPRIKETASGKFSLRIRVNGKQVLETADSPAELLAWEHQAKADAARGVYIDPSDASTTFREYAEQWFTAQVWEHGTRQSVRNTLDKHLYPRIGSVPLSRLRPTQLQGVIGELALTLDPNTIQNVTASQMSWVLNAAVRDRMIPSNPATGLKLPKVPPREPTIPTVEQVVRLADAIDPRSRALVVVGSALGLRQGEAFGLSVDRIDFLRHRVRIDRQLKRDRRGSILGTLKTENSYRTIPLPDSAAFELARHIERFPNDDPDGLLFTASLGGRLRRDGWGRRTWKPAAMAAGRPDLTYHALRHFYASALIRAGQSAPTVARRLGNTPKMVLDTYAHLWADDDDRTRQAIDDVLVWRPPEAGVIAERLH